MTSIARDLQALFAKGHVDLARAALVVAGLEYPGLDPDPSLATLDRLGADAADRLRALDGQPLRARVGALSHFLFTDAGFAANRDHYDDFRNSLLNVVLERRLGIPITLSLVYMEVARRAGLTVRGVAFPAHFLMLVPEADPDGPGLLLDPFADGREIDEAGCRAILVEHLGDDAAFDAALLRPCSARQFVARLLNNLKRTYVEMRSFEQALQVTDLLLAIDPTMYWELRDRGLLAYHLEQFPAALRDLEAYLRLIGDDGEDERQAPVREHVRQLRRRVGNLN